MHDREGAEQMEMIYNWILKLSFFAVLGSVILQMIPDHGFQKYVRFVLGLILAAMPDSRQRHPKKKIRCIGRTVKATVKEVDPRM